MRFRVWTSFMLLVFAASVHGDKLQEEMETSELRWTYQARPILAYAFGSNQFKPYVRELYTLNGDNVLRDAPSDHLHHHGLMYAIRVNGVNFWEENQEPGCQKSIRLLSHSAGKNEKGLPEASLTQLIHWMAGTNKSSTDPEGATLLMERRTLTLTLDERSNEIALIWHAAFEVGKQPVTLTGARYNGLGFRLPVTFDKVASFQSTEKLGEKKTEQVFGADWASVSGEVNGRKAVAALFGLPKNAGQTTFFAMAEPFTYLSVTQRLDQKAIEYAAGETFELRYLVVVYGKPKSAEALNERYRLWEKTGR